MRKESPQADVSSALTFPVGFIFRNDEFFFEILSFGPFVGYGTFCGENVTG